MAENLLSVRKSVCYYNGYATGWHVPLMHLVFSAHSVVDGTPLSTMQFPPAAVNM